MSYGVREFGGVRVHALCDGVGPHFQPRVDCFPAATPEQWAAADRLDPAAAGPDGTWLLHFHCYAIRWDDGRTVLVDAGIGPADAPAATWAPVPGRLPEQLARAGIEPDEVDLVVLTHLHTDHVGWAATGRRPYFRNARYALQRAELESAQHIAPATFDGIVTPLHESGQLDLLDGDRVLAPGLRAVATPGHTPGHQCVVLDGGGRTLALTGDLVLHAVHLVDAAIGYGLDQDAVVAGASRAALVNDLRTRPPGQGPSVLATAHLTEPFHDVA
jgi:glyoxylase-like metal-dependent hydrolase (beta-lactamase superfamily II)